MDGNVSRGGLLSQLEEGSKIKKKIALKKSNHRLRLFQAWEGVLPYVGFIGMCSPNENHGFLAVLVVNRILILAILVSNRVWFWH